ncbi:MAG: phosphopantetheine-binding protein [Bacteroidia bacterium]
MNFNTLDPPTLLQANQLEGIRSQLQLCYCDLIGTDAVDRDCSFLEAGGTSMDVLHLQFFIQERFQVELKFGTIYRFSTINLLSLVIQEAMGREVEAEMFMLRQAEFPEKVIAFIDTKGVDFLECLEVSKCFGDGLDVAYLEWKAWDTGRWLRPQVDAFAEAYAQLLLQRYPAIPMVVAASCDGAIVALEVTRRLRAIRPDVGLVIIDTRGHCPERLTASYYWKRFRSYLASPTGDHWQKLRRHLKVLASRVLHSGKPGAGTTTPNGAVSWLAGIHLAPIEGDLHLIRGLQSHIDSPRDESLGWRQLTLGKFELHWMEGTHQSMWEPPHSKELAGLLQKLTNRCKTAAPSRERPPQYS